MTPATYTIHLDTFHGPLDLLLYLVKRHEVDILDIPIARIADQFLEYVRAVREIDVEFAGEFLVMAATLMEIKSRLLLPAAGSDDASGDRPDPRRELVKQLLEYRRYKDAAAALGERAEAHAVRLARQEPGEPATPAGPVVKPVELWDLVSAFARILRETEALRPVIVYHDDTPQSVYEQQVRDRVRSAGRLPFRAAFTPPYHRPRLVGTFLAILELVRRHRLGLEFGSDQADIWLLDIPEPAEPSEAPAAAATAGESGGEPPSGGPQALG